MHAYYDFNYSINAEGQRHKVLEAGIAAQPASLQHTFITAA